MTRFLPVPVAATLLGLIVVVSLIVVLQVEVNNAPEIYFPSDADAVLIDAQVRETFPQDQVLVALFDGKNAYSTTFLSAIENVVRELTALDATERVLSVVNVDSIRGTEDGFVIESLLGLADVRELTDQERKVRALSDRFAPGLLVSEDGSAMALILRPKRLNGSLQRLGLEQAFMRAVESAGIAGDLIGISGNLPLDVAMLRSTIRNTSIFVPTTVITGLVLIWWMFRSRVAVFVAALAMVAVAGAAVATLVGSGKPYTLISAMIAPLMAGLTIALLVHLYNGIVYASRRGAMGAEAVRKAVESVRKPALFTALTTAAGLGSLGLSPIQPIMGFGIASAVGALVLYGVVIWIVPSFLARWCHSDWSAETVAERLVNRVTRQLSRWALRHAGAVLVITAVILALGAPALWKVRAETDLYEFFAPSDPLIQATEQIERRLSGVTALEVVFDAPGRDSLTDPQRLVTIKRFQDWLEELPQVDRVVSMVDMIEEMHWAFHGEDPSFRILPDDRALIDQYLFVYDGNDLFDLVNRELDRTLVAVHLNVRGANAVGEVMAEIRSYIGAQDLVGMTFNIAGFGRLFADQEDLLITGQVRSLGAALVAIFLFMLLLWRSLWDSLLCMIPNVAPILVIFVIMGFAGIWLDMATAMIASVAVGIAVDDTIHVFHGYRERRNRGAKAHAAILRSYRQAGRAVVITTMILCAQFLLFMVSDFVPTAQFGLLTSAGLLAALAFDLLLLPAIVLVAANWESRRQRA